MRKRWRQGIEGDKKKMRVNYSCPIAWIANIIHMRKRWRQGRRR
jgi:hypothetical protein